MTIEEQIKKVVCTKFKIDVVGKKTRFVDDLAAESLEMLEFVMELEDEFQINIPENDIRNGLFETVGALINYIKERTSTQEVEVKKLKTH
jgi:acyl carrier protein